MILFDFLCNSCANEFEELVDKDKLVCECPECGSEATRQISAPRVKLDGCSGHFPGEALKWERIRREHHTKGSKSDEDWGS
jgi:putative FmdB family regulatory protein